MRRLLHGLSRQYKILLPPGSLRARLAGGAFWSLISAVVGQGSAVIASIVVARLLGKADFGKYGMVNSTVGFFGALSGFGLGSIASRYTAQYRATDPDRVSRVIGLAFAAGGAIGGVISLTTALFADSLAVHFLGSNELSYFIRLGSLQILFGTISGVQGGALYGLQAFRTIALVICVLVPLAAIASIVGARLFGLEGVVVIATVSAFVNMIVWSIVLRRLYSLNGIRVDFLGAYLERGLLASFALPLFLASIVVPLVNWVADAFLVNSTRGYAQLGLFNAVDQWRSILLFLPNMVMGPLLPITTELFAQGEFRRLRRALIQCMISNFVLCIPATLLVGVFASQVMRLYGPDFEGSEGTLRLILVIVVLMSLNTVTAQLLMAIGQIWLGFAFNVIWALVALVAAKVLIDGGYGAFGLALSFVVAYLVHTLVQVSYLLHKLRIFHRDPNL